MKTLSKSILMVLCVTLLSSAQLLGQEWSEEQKEVWKNVETYWDLDTKEDLEGFLSYFHDDYSGWYNLYPLPSDKARARKTISQGYKTTETLVHDIQPVAIKIHSNVAIVQYYYSRVFKDAEGKEKNENGHWTDILMKQGDKWVLIGDDGGPSAD